MEAVGVVVVVGLVGLAVALFAAGPAPAAVTATDAGLVVRARGVAAALAMRRTVEIPWRAVTAVRVARDVKTPKGLRFPGAYVPGPVTAGSFRWVGERSFWLRRRAGELLVIDADRGEGSPYDRLVLEVADPAAVVAAVDARRPLQPA